MFKALPRLLDRAIFYSLLILIVLTAIPYGTVEPWWKALFQVAVFTLGGLWVIESLLTGRWGINQPHLLLPLLAIIIFAFVQTLPLWSVPTTDAGISVRKYLSFDPFETRLFIYQFLALTLVGVLLMRYASQERRFRLLIHLVIGIGVASALFGLMRQFMQQGSGFFLPHLEPGRGYGQFINPNHFAFLMEMSLGMTLGLIVGGGVRGKRLLFYLLATLPMLIALVLSLSRGGIFSLICQALFLALMFSSFRLEQDSSEGKQQEFNRWLRWGHLLVVRTILILSLLTALFISILWMGGEPLVTRLEGVPTEFGPRASDRYANTLRLKIWQVTWQIIKDHPIAGVGFGGYWIAFPKYHQGSGEFTAQEAHNDYLELLASGGLIGTALVIWFVIALVKRARQQLLSSNPYRRAVCLGALTGLFGVAVHSFVDFGLHITINALIFTTLIVIATIDTRTFDNDLRRGVT